MKKPVIYTEIAYFAAMILLALGTALMVYGDFGMSMVLAPAYILHLYLSRFLPFFSFGVAEYVLQAAVLLLLTLIMRKGKMAYLLSFAATVLYGIILDSAIFLTAFLPQSIYLRIAAYVIGGIVCCSALALLFGCYLPPAAYELFSKEIAAKTGRPVHKIVNYYNIGSLTISVLFSLLLFGQLRGVGIGTVICAFSYGFLIRKFQVLYSRYFRFVDRFPYRPYFEFCAHNDKSA